MKSKEECFEMDFPEDGEDFVGNMFDIYSKGFDSGRSQIAKQEREIAVNKALEVASEEAEFEMDKYEQHIIGISKQSILSLAPQILKELNKEK